METGNFVHGKKTCFCFLCQMEFLFICIRNPKTQAGAGGFHAGLKIAHEELRSDYYWMMDDDGYPTEGCLEMLLRKVDEYDYVTPVSIDIDNHENLSWATRKRNGKKTIVYKKLKDSCRGIRYIAERTIIHLKSYESLV